MGALPTRKRYYAAGPKCDRALHKVCAQERDSMGRWEDTRVEVVKSRFTPLGVPKQTQTKRRKKTLEGRRSSNNGSWNERWTGRLKFGTKGEGTSNEETQTVRTFCLRQHLAKGMWNGGKN